MKAFILSLFAFLCVGAIAPAIADDHAGKATEGGAMLDPKVMEEMMKIGMPSEHHALFEKLAGSWDYTITFRMMPGMPESTSTGVAEHKVILGGRYLEQRVEGPMDMGGQTIQYVGQGYLGYDNHKEAYQSLWIDNMNTAMMTGVGSYDETTKTLTETGEHFCGIQGRDVPYKTELKLIDDENVSYTMSQKQDDGSYFNMMEITYKKK